MACQHPRIEINAKAVQRGADRMITLQGKCLDCQAPVLWRGPISCTTDELALSVPTAMGAPRLTLAQATEEFRGLQGEAAMPIRSRSFMARH